MNADVNALLSAVTAKLNEMSLAMQTPVVSVAPLAASAPTSGGDNNDDLDTEADDTIDIYLSSLVDRVMHQYDATDSEAANVVFAAIEGAVESGKMPELPEEGAAGDALATWVGKASTGGLQKIVDDFAKAHAA
jgi:hypothetical protein